LTRKLKFLYDFFSILEDLNTNYWLEGGTALAAYRDGKIFDWEHDFDIGVLKDDFEKDIELFIKKLSLINCTIKIQKNYPFIDNIIQIYSNDPHSNPNQIDIYLFTENKNNIYMRWLNSPIGFGSKIIKSILYLTSIKLSNYENRKKISYILADFIFKIFIFINYNFFKSTYHSFPKKFFERRKKIIFCEMNLNLPYMIDEFLEYRYGKNWKNPDKNFNQKGKWKKSKARPILPQNFLKFPKYDYNVYKLKNNVNKKNK